MSNTHIGPKGKTNKTWMPIAAGFFTVINGVLTILGGLTLLSVAELLPGIRTTWVGEAYWGLPLMVAGVVAFIGGIFAFRRRRWKLAIAGAVCSLLMLDWTLTGIFAIIFLFQSREEFI